MEERTSGVLLKALLGACSIGMGYADPCHGELYSLRLPDLESWYGGITGPDYRDTSFDFQQHFTAVNQAWLHVEATPDDLEYPNYIAYAANVNGHWWEGGGGGEAFLDPWETLVVDIALPTGPGMLQGWGYVEMLIYMDCCDGVVIVTDATLWFDATPVPEPGSLALLGLGVLALRRSRR